MNTTRLLTTLAAAAALTGGIGIAYAQTTTGATPSTTSAGMTGTSPAMSSTSTMPAATNTTTTAPTEPTPKADRG